MNMGDVKVKTRSGDLAEGALAGSASDVFAARDSGGVRGAPRNCKTHPSPQVSAASRATAASLALPANALSVLLLLLSFFAAPAFAQQCTVVKVDMATPDASKAAGAAMVVRIPAPGSVIMAAGDAQNMLAVGVLAGTRAKVNLYNLAADGSAAAAGVIDLPLAPELEKIAVRPVSLVFHPKLPLLYVWQELLATPADIADPKKPFIKEKFFHGLIYQVGAGGPKLLESFANGWAFDFAPGSYNSLAISPTGKRIFPPAAFVGNEGPASGTALAYYELGDDGLTVKGDDKITPLLVRQPWGDAASYGWGCVPGNDNVVVIAQRSGICTWDIDNRLARYTVFYLNVNGGSLRIGGESAAPAIYASSVASGNAYSMQHVEGYITLVPKTIALPVPLTSRPVAMTKRKIAAIPAKEHVYLAGVDDNGDFTGKVMDVSSVGFMGYSMAYSQKTDRVYITVETAQ